MSQRAWQKARQSWRLKQPPGNQCPDAWARRHRHRTEGVAAIKRSQEYQHFYNCSQEFQDSCRLRLRLDEPDPI